MQFDLPAGEYLMRAAVREPGGLVGTADRRFSVRALDGPGIVSGDLLVTSARGELPVRAAAYTGDGLTAALPLYARTTEQLASARVVIDLVAIGESTAIVSGFADLRDATATDRGAVREARIELPLQSVAPGAYLARAKVTVGADTVAEAVREVVVRAGQRPAVGAADDDPTFDAREVASTIVSREFVARLARQSSAAAVDARRAVDRLAACGFSGRGRVARDGVTR